MGEKVLAFESGGTNFVTGVVERNNKEIESVNRVNISHKGEKEYISSIIETLETTLEESSVSLDEISSIGIVSAGKWDFEKGTVTPPNLPFKGKNLRIAEKVGEHFGKEVYGENDVNAGVLAEMLFGHGKTTDARFVGYLTISTGIGLGIYDTEKDEIISGETGQAPEVGHNIVEPNGLRCGCGGRGHWEAYGSGKGVEKLAKKMLEEDFDAKEVYDRAEEGKDEFMEVIDKSAEYNAIGVGQVINAYQPGILVFGGTPVFKSREIVFENIRDRIKHPEHENKYTYVDDKALPEMVVSKLGGNNILLGAGATALKKLEGKRVYKP